MLTGDQVFHIAFSLIMTMASTIFYLWTRQQDRDQKAMNEKIEALDQRLDDASEHSSALSGKVQALIGRVDRLPEDLRGKFFPVDRATDLIAESRQDRKALWDEVRALSGRARERP